MNKKETGLLFLICYILMLLVTASAIIPEVGLPFFLVGAVVATFLFFFVPARILIFVGSRTIRFIKNHRKVDQDG